MRTIAADRRHVRMPLGLASRRGGCYRAELDLADWWDWSADHAARRLNRRPGLVVCGDSLVASAAFASFHSTW